MKIFYKTDDATLRAIISGEDENVSLPMSVILQIKGLSASTLVELAAEELVSRGSTSINEIQELFSTDNYPAHIGACHAIVSRFNYPIKRLVPVISSSLEAYKSGKGTYLVAEAGLRTFCDRADTTTDDILALFFTPVVRKYFGGRLVDMLISKADLSTNDLTKLIELTEQGQGTKAIRLLAEKIDAPLDFLGDMAKSSLDEPKDRNAALDALVGYCRNFKTQHSTTP